jgi:hypothetical protein
MPKLYEYLGIVIFFYANDHESIHIHARKGEYENKAEIILVEGKIEKIVLSNVRSRKSLPVKDRKNLKIFLEHYADEIVTKWINYFVYNKDVDFKRISKKL